MVRMFLAMLGGGFALLCLGCFFGGRHDDGALFGIFALVATACAIPPRSAAASPAGIDPAAANFAEIEQLGRTVDAIEDELAELVDKLESLGYRTNGAVEVLNANFARVGHFLNVELPRHYAEAQLEEDRHRGLMHVTEFQGNQIGDLCDKFRGLKDRLDALETAEVDDAPFVGQTVRYVDPRGVVWPAKVVLATDPAEPGGKVDLFVFTPGSSFAWEVPFAAAAEPPVAESWHPIPLG